MHVRIGLVSLAVSFVVACASSTLSSGSAEDDVNGGRVAEDDPAVVMVHFETGQFCSGTLVAPDRVLTAAHCLKYVADFVYVGVGVPTSAYDQETSLRTMQAHPVAGQAIHPEYLPYVQRNGFDRCPLPVPDLGVVRLAEPLADITPVPLSTHIPEYGAVCRSVGFGAYRTSRTTYTYQQKRTAVETLSEVKPNAIKTRYGTGISDKGDSGGALLCDEQLVGVTSCHDDEQDNRRYEVYARHDVAAAWLREQGVGLALDGGSAADAGVDLDASDPRLGGDHGRSDAAVDAVDASESGTDTD